MENKTAIQKAADTINSIRAELENMPGYDARTLNEVEGRIRVELQVMEALVNHIGREVYQKVQERRQQLRGENQRWIQNAVSPAEERVRAILGDEFMEKERNDGTGDSGTNGDTWVGEGDADKSSGAKRKGNSKTSRSSGQSGRKK